VTRTLTWVDRPASEGASRRVVTLPTLVLALECGAPTARPARFSLEGVDEVQIGRGVRRTRVREERTLRVSVPDSFMSSRHACLKREPGGWIAQDLGSKNGTRHRSQPLDQAPLADGDLVVAGSTVFIYFEALDVFEDEDDLDLSALALEDAALATLHASFAQQVEDLRRVARAALPVLVHGETGTGKELVARALHEHAERGGEFVAVNCGALPATLVPSELFGARKGAYSGAEESRTGLVRSADGGTLFLDEIAELPLEAQAALLRVLQEGEVLPVGADRAVPVDVRVVAATHRDLEACVREGTFREDLYGRIAGHVLELPALRQRPADLGLIIGTLLLREGRTKARLGADAAERLFRYAWPRNVRELEHALTSACARVNDGAILEEHLPAAMREQASTARAAVGAPDAGADPEARFRDAARRLRGNVSAIAQALATSRSQVRRLAERYGVDLSAERES